MMNILYSNTLTEEVGLTSKARSYEDLCETSKTTYKTTWRTGEVEVTSSNVRM